MGFFICIVEVYQGGIQVNFRVYILATATVIVGLVELIVGGILPVIATDLNISIGSAGQLITVFALVYAISGPVLLSLTAKVERKKLYLISLFVFFKIGRASCRDRV